MHAGVSSSAVCGLICPPNGKTPNRNISWKYDTAASGYDLLKTFHPKHGAEALGRMPADGHEWTVLVIGFVV